MAAKPKPVNGVFKGRTTPLWGCKCGGAYNYACRVKCRQCGSNAPWTVYEKAEAEHIRATARQPRADRGGRSGPSRRRPSPRSTTKVEQELAELRAENARLKGESPKDAQDEDPDDTSIADLEAVRRTLLGKPALAAMLSQVDAQLAKKRAERNANKSHTTGGLTVHQ